METSNDIFICALLFDGQGGAQPLDAEQIENWQPDQGLLWLHIDCANEAGRQWLVHQSGIDEVLSTALLDEDTRPRVTHFSALQSLVFLRGVNLAQGAEPEDMVSLRIFATRERILTTRWRKLMSVSDIIAALKRGEGPVSTSDFLAQISDLLLNRIDTVVEELEEQMDELEETLIDENAQRLRGDLNALRRRSIKLRRYLGPQREALAKLATERRSWIDEDSRLQLQECTDRLVRFVEELDVIRERAIVAQEELTSQVSDQINQRMYVMSLIAAIFLPLSFITGLLGINVGGIPWAQSPLGFVIVSSLLIVIGGLILVLFKFKKWF
ncbi:zinc transporter ZntB [Celerinatantimonas diazotrophica]|uniref:Zinc transporter n=1 Tax=Celerinatantimonas diazotrophica TaxID=412034 RepID=A0A4R1JLM4_9GAMM|nr:zinc transporter ZntB [Celerinatantimonas diazotrophica]TCK51897.1 zinc transporter [Celerinatantimonas diazotrophica]CAG9296407.1 Zinc transport protein ZntB [Celerinatantimonas diazotrophica]